MKKITTDDLLIYLFNECSDERAQEIRHAIDTDAALYSEFEKLKKIRENLDSSSEPDVTSILAVNQYSKDFNSANAISIFFNETEFSAVQIAEAISHLSDIYKEVGGDYLVIRNISTEIVQTKDPILEY